MRLHAATLLVPDYDDGIEFYVGKLGFTLTSDIELDPVKRWVLVTPPSAKPHDGDTHLLIAKATTDMQIAGIGQQAGDRVGFFLHTDNFDADHQRFVKAGVQFEEAPRVESYGTVAVFRDPWGNRWDLLKLR